MATRALAPQDASRAALIGTGPQAVTQLAALAEVRELRRVRVYSPTAEKRRAFIAAASARYAFEIEESPLAHALADAEIVTLITRAVEPFVDAAQLADCRHLNAVGAILPAKAEFAQDVFERADRWWSTTWRTPGAVRASCASATASCIVLAGVSRLSDVLAAGETRAPDARLTLFKGMGMGLSDLAMATVVYEQALARGLGGAAAADPRNLLAQG